MSTTDSVSKDVMYYDGSCPLCTAEVCKLSRYTKGNVELQDIHQLENAEGLPDKETLLKKLHVRTREGDWLIGIDANIRAWHHTPYAAWWRVLGWPVIRIFSSAAYALWLACREFNKSKQRQSDD